jgi:hypothetical protein
MISPFDTEWEVEEIRKECEGIKMSKGPEAKLKAECRAWLREQGAYVFSPVQMGYGAATVDDLVCIEGRFFGIEYKVQPKKPTPRQEKTLEEILEAGGIVCVIYDFEELKKIVRQSTDVL